MEQKKVSQSRQKKQQIVAKLAEKAAKAKGLIFTNYQGLTHQQLEALKKALKTTQAELVVTKNTLLKLALEQSQKSKVKSQNLERPTATLFLYGDPIEPLKQLAKTIRELNLPTIKLGIIEGNQLTSEQIMQLSTLPSRDILIMQLLGQMKSPIYGLHRALGWNLQKFVLTLKAIETKKNS